ncbi:F-BAR domain only protein 2 isoform X1 [Parasteatoda tepidariorum]|uniref:F-BAR domain only protein 2 isoform X1 n=1 Tax=Parasteatoda tepidariorum TaxID=114398 RepID=UPI001C71D681|nr:F-BAR domain only protein 2 isoform X3 [Parasteatoda tepidariorum]
MPVDFRDCFWGEGNNGFHVLYRNMKYGYVVSKDLAEFFKERSVIEETNSKLLSKLAKHASNCCSQGSFAPLWSILRTSTEKLATLHMQMVQRFQELIKDIIKYSEDQHKRHKSCKEEESGTCDVVQTIQLTTIALQKAKENFNARSMEYEKLRRDNASLKELEKAEMKCKKACDDYKFYIDKYSTVREDFEKKMMVTCEHFQSIEEAHIKQIKVFLSNYAHVLESGHALIGQVHVEFLQQCNEMDVDKLLEHMINERGTGTEKPGPVSFEDADLSPIGQPQSPDSSENHNEEKSYKKEGKKMSLHRKSKPSRRTTSLLDLFFSSSLGNSDPSGVTNSTPPNNQVIENDNDVPKPTPPIGNTLNRTNFRASKYWQSYWNSWSSGFLKSKREKRKEKKKKKMNGIKDDSGVTSGDGDSQDRVTNPQIDAEGFTIRPPERNQEYQKDPFYSSSDNDSDATTAFSPLDDDEKDCKNRIHIEIKPVSNCTGMSASNDELIATVGKFSLSPDPQRTINRPTSSAASTPDEGPLKRSISMSNPLNKADTDLFSIFSPSASSASTPTGPAVGGFPSPSSSIPNSKPPSLGEMAQSTTESKNSVALDSSSEVEPELANNEVQKPLSTSRVGTPTSSILLHVLPRPPSRRAFEATTRGRMSPLPYAMTRTESISSLTSDFKTTSMPVGSSRGPSPLTIGMSDTIPLAIAFNEIVNACFKGTDETRCQVRLMGDMKVSFPAGIVQVLANNPSPAHLVFKLSKASKIETILPNKQLISLDPSQSTKEQYVYEFNMQALTALLRKQYEQSPTASYFNIDILKYHIKTLHGAKSTPLHLVAYWKCEPTSTDLRIDYKFNASSLSNPSSLSNINIIVPVNGGVTDVQSKPKIIWNSDTSRAMWKLAELSQSSDGGGLGSLRAHFDLSSGPSSVCALAAQFICNNTSLSGAEFELVGLGYRLSLVKKQVVAGKYLCESDPVSNYYG